MSSKRAHSPNPEDETAPKRLELTTPAALCNDVRLAVNAALANAQYTLSRWKCCLCDGKPKLVATTLCGVCVSCLPCMQDMVANEAANLYSSRGLYPGSFKSPWCIDMSGYGNITCPGCDTETPFDYNNHWVCVLSGFLVADLI